MVGELVMNIVRRSIPIPSPDVGGIPYSSAQSRQKYIFSDSAISAVRSGAVVPPEEGTKASERSFSAATIFDRFPSTLFV